ncbi:MAG: cytochrome c-type biogenesis protein CcmH [Proteobacteria bacterium]|nr:cytochrome c-type biogenesis protein CcmH [Pseudomonadota bacterium]
MKQLVFALLFICFTTSAWAVTHPDERLKDPALEARAVALSQTLRCVVCQNESIEASHADIAKDLRRIVRTQIAVGKTDDEIRAFLQARYGDYVFLEPPFTPRTWLLWLIPIAVMACGCTMASLHMLKRRRRK